MLNHTVQIRVSSYKHNISLSIAVKPEFFKGIIHITNKTHVIKNISSRKISLIHKHQISNKKTLPVCDNVTSFRHLQKNCKNSSISTSTTKQTIFQSLRCTLYIPFVSPKYNPNFETISLSQTILNKIKTTFILKCITHYILSKQNFQIQKNQ